MVKPKEEKSFEELKLEFHTLVQDITAQLIIKDQDIPAKMQEIPELFEGWSDKRFTSSYREPSKAPRTYKLDAGKTVKAALWIARKYDLVPKDTPLRQVWYAFIKLALQKSGNPIGHQIKECLMHFLRL